jgi:hypothetical protein
VQGELKQLVAVQLNVVRIADPKEIGSALTNMLANPENPNDINGADLSTDRSARQATRPPSNSQGMLGSFLRPRAGAIRRGDPVKTTLDHTKPKSPRHFRPRLLPLSHFLFFSNFKFLTNAP